MSKEQDWLMIDLHTHSGFSKLRKPNDNVKDMSPEEYVDILYSYGVKAFSITDHNYFADSYYDDIDKYISLKNYDLKIINGVELDVYVEHKTEKNAFIHICFYFDGSVNRKKLHDCIENLYQSKDSRPNFKTILIKLSELNCKIITIPHGDKERGLLDHYLIDHIVADDRKEFYKYAMYKIFNGFDIKPGSINDSENHWALNFYEKTMAFDKLTSEKTKEEIDTIRQHIIDYLKGLNNSLTNDEKIIFDYAKAYGAFYAYFSFSDWHNCQPYNPAINNFIFGCTDYAFNSFELATLDPISRIEKTIDKKIEISDSLIKNVSFKINQHEKNIYFSPGLNAIVGKRGSGKSLLVSVIRNLAKGDDKNGALQKYNKLKISDISCLNRGNILLSIGQLSSVELLEQNEIKDIIDNPSMAQEKIKEKFPPIKEIDLSNINRIVELCDLITPFNTNYKGITSELISSKTTNNYTYKENKTLDFSDIESGFSSAINNLENIKQKLNNYGFNVSHLINEIKNLKNVKREYLVKAELFNGLINNINAEIKRINKELTINQDNARRNISNINDAFEIISSNLDKALVFKMLKHVVSDFVIQANPVSIAREGRYLFATYYDLKPEIKNDIKIAISSTLTYSSDTFDNDIQRYLDGDDKRRIKSGFNSLGDGLRNMIKNNYFTPKQSFYEISNKDIDYKKEIKSFDALKEHIDKGNLIDLNSASLGMKSVAYLNMLFDLENKILVFDQPEDNIDNDYISNHLVPIIKSNKKIKQLIFVTHNPSVAVYGDAFNYVYAANDEEINYSNYLIEDIEDKEKLLKILEGGRSSFSNRNKKYGDIIGDEIYGN